MKRTGLVLVLGTLLWRTVLAQDYAPGQVFVIFKPGAVDSLFTNATALTCCGIPKIDSINQANGCQQFFPTGYPGIVQTRNDYLVVFPDSANVQAIGAAYMTDPNVKWAGPNWKVEPLFTPNDSLFNRKDLGPAYQPMDSSQWALDSLHLKLERAWDITKGDTGVVVAIVDFGTLWTHEDIQPNLWINSLEDICCPAGAGNGKLDTLQFPNGDLDGVDQDGNGYVDDVIGFNFTNPAAPGPIP